MKIVYIAASPVPSGAANSVHVMKMCQALIRAGHDVCLIAPEYNRAEDMALEGDIYARYGISEPFPIMRTPHLRPAVLGVRAHLAAARWYLWRMSPDLVYTRCLRAADMASRAGYQVIFERHDTYLNQKAATRSLFENLMARENVRALVVISQALKDHLLGHFKIPAEKILVFHDGADPMPETSGPAPFEKKPGRLAGGYIGHLYRGRGIDVIGAVARMRPEVDFHIVGGRAEDLAEWKNRLAGVGNLYFHGHVSHAETTRFLAAFDFVMAPYQRKIATVDGSDTSGWMSPLKIFEYMSSGKPILCSDLPVLREVLEDGRTALFCTPDDPEAWSAAIGRLVAEAGSARGIGATALAEFSGKYTWQARARDILAAAITEMPSSGKVGKRGVHG